MLSDKTMDDKSIYIPNEDNITIHSQDLLKSLNTTSLEPTNNNSIPKVFLTKEPAYFLFQYPLPPCILFQHGFILL